MKISVGVLTISDRCSNGTYEDKSGPSLIDKVEYEGWEIKEYTVIPDKRDEIKKVIHAWATEEKLSLILTSGGTGLGPNDITPEVTRELIDKKIPGISEQIRMEGLKKTPCSLLSRGVAGVLDKSIIINLPGSPAGAVESLEAVKGLIAHACKMVLGEGH